MARIVSAAKHEEPRQVAQEDERGVGPDEEQAREPDRERWRPEGARVVHGRRTGDR